MSEIIYIFKNFLQDIKKKYLKANLANGFTLKRLLKYTLKQNLNFNKEKLSLKSKFFK